MHLHPLIQNPNAYLEHGKREDLLKYAPTVLKIVQDSKLDKHENVVIQKLGVKLMQRLGLTFLKVHKSPTYLVSCNFCTSELG